MEKEAGQFGDVNAGQDGGEGDGVAEGVVSMIEDGVGVAEAVTSTTSDCVEEVLSVSTGLAKGVLDAGSKLEESVVLILGCACGGSVVPQYFANRTVSLRSAWPDPPIEL